MHRCRGQVADGGILFLDEIQLCPRALVALRYFYEEMPDLHVIAAGSLLEFEMEKISFPVGERQRSHFSAVIAKIFPLAMVGVLRGPGPPSGSSKRDSILLLQICAPVLAS